MADDKLIKGISSQTGLTSMPTGGFKQLDSNQIKDLDYEQLKDYISDLLQKKQADQLATVPRGLTGEDEANAAKVLTTLSKNSQAGSNPYGVDRLPWVFATFKDLGGAELGSNVPLPEKSLIWYANPKSVDWRITQRATETKTKSGTVLHVWRDRRRRTDYDDPKITMTFQSGNIMKDFKNAYSPSQTTEEAALAPGLNNFYRFLELVDQSKISKGRANLVHILYRSRIFPSMTLTGFFDPQTVVSFSDSSDNPFQVNSWSATFTIYNSTPQLNNWTMLKNRLEAEFASDPLNANYKK